MRDVLLRRIITSPPKPSFMSSLITTFEMEEVPFTSWKQQNGKHILYLDMPNITESEFQAFMYRIPSFVNATAPDSFRVLLNAEGLKFTPAMIKTLTEVGRYPIPNVTKRAVVGITPGVVKVAQATNVFLRNPIRMFHSAVEAWAYVAS